MTLTANAAQASAIRITFFAFRLYLSHSTTFILSVLLVVLPIGMSTFTLIWLASSSGTDVSSLLNHFGLGAPSLIARYFPAGHNILQVLQTHGHTVPSALLEVFPGLVVGASTALLVIPLLSILVLIALSEICHQRAVRPLACLMAAWRFLPATIVLYLSLALMSILTSLALSIISGVVSILTGAMAQESSSLIWQAVGLYLLLSVFGSAEGLLFLAVAVLFLVAFVALTQVVVQRSSLWQATKRSVALVVVGKNRSASLRQALLLLTFTFVAAISLEIVLVLAATFFESAKMPVIIYGAALSVVVAVFFQLVVLIYSLCSVQAIALDGSA